MPTSKHQRPPCRRCGQRYPSRPGGACWVCWKARAARRSDLRSRFAERGLGIVPPTKPAAEPCRALQGSQAKVDAMAARLANGEELWHREDGE